MYFVIHVTAALYFYDLSISYYSYSTGFYLKWLADKEVRTMEGCGSDPMAQRGETKKINLKEKQVIIGREKHVGKMWKKLVSEEN
jgi:hypothetical protein